jgi:general secretion pathway protein G
MVNSSSTRRDRGFTLIELLIVVTIIGIIAGIAVVNVRHAQTKAQETVLRANLAQMRKAIDDFYADKLRYPTTLQELVDAKYMRKIPPDPITKKSDTWIEVKEEPTLDNGSTLSNPTSAGPATPGIVDVKSGAEGKTLDDVSYGEL